KAVVHEIGADDVPSLSAAIAYYTVFSLPPLLVIIVAVAGLWAGPDAVREVILGEADSLIGPAAARSVEGMIENAGDLGDEPGAKLIGVLALFVGASGAFGALQRALNRAWGVTGSGAGGWKGLVFKRLLSFGMVLVIGFFLLASVVLSAVLAVLSETITDITPLGIPAWVWQFVNSVGSFVVIAGLFAVLFKVLPDAVVA